MERIIGDYFCDLYKSSNPSPADIELVLESVQPKISSSKSAFLDSAFSAEDIRKAVFEIGATKAPGKDGFPALFYHRFWSTVGLGVVKACLECLNNGASMASDHSLNEHPQ